MRTYWIVLAVILLSTVVSAETITQSSFQSLGFAAFENNQPNESSCRDFLLFKDLNKNSADYYTIVSLRVQFEPVASADANVTVFLDANPEALATSEATDFRDNWWRVQLPNEQLREQNNLTVCLNNSSSTTRSVLLADSLFGTYKTAEFKPEDFAKTVSNYQPLYGQEFVQTVSLKNSGSEAATVHIQYEKPGISFRHLAFVKGDTNFDGIILPGQTVSFSYSMKSTQTGPFTLPAAIVFYSNIFGEEEKLVSNYPVIEVKEPDIKVQAVVLNKTVEKRIVPGKALVFQVLLTNYGQFELSNIALIFPEQEGLSLNSQKNILVSSLKPGENKTIDFSVTPNQPGSYTIGCKLAYLDFGVKGAECDASSIIVESDSFPIEYVGGIILIVVALLVYLYYRYR
jgi:hypothetical protein